MFSLEAEADRRRSIRWRLGQSRGIIQDDILRWPEANVSVAKRRVAEVSVTRRAGGEANITKKLGARDCILRSVARRSGNEVSASR